jgi:hypothetical protein
MRVAAAMMSGLTPEGPGVVEVVSTAVSWVLVAAIRLPVPREPAALCVPVAVY